MAGAGYKLFNTGDVLTAAQVNTYLQEQVVMVFANSTARTTALSGVLAEGMMSYLQDTNAVQVYNGTSWVGVGGSSPLTTKGDVYTYSTADARLGVGANGTVLTADSAETTGLKWATPGFTYATYTPTFTGFTKGNATVTARWAQSGKAVNVFVEVILGSTSSVSGSITISLPVTAATSALNTRGIGGITDTGVRVYSAVPVLNSTTAIELKPLAASLATTAEDDISATNPMTWTNTDRFCANITYEAA